MNKNRIQGVSVRRAATAKSISIKHAERRSGDCARKAAELTSGDLPGRQKSAEGIVGLTSARLVRHSKPKGGVTDKAEPVTRNEGPNETAEASRSWISGTTSGRRPGKHGTLLWRVRVKPRKREEER